MSYEFRHDETNRKREQVTVLRNDIYFVPSYEFVVLLSFSSSSVGMHAHAHAHSTRMLETYKGHFIAKESTVAQILTKFKRIN